MSYQEPQEWAYNLHDDDGSSSASDGEEGESDSTGQTWVAADLGTSRKAEKRSQIPQVGSSAPLTARPSSQPHQSLPSLGGAAASSPSATKCSDQQPDKVLRRVKGTVEDSQRDKKRRRRDEGSTEGGGKLGDDLSKRGSRGRVEQPAASPNLTFRLAPAHPATQQSSSSLTRIASAALMPPPPLPPASKDRSTGSSQSARQLGRDRLPQRRQQVEAAQKHFAPLASQQDESRDVRAAFQQVVAPDAPIVSTSARFPSSSRRPFLPPEPRPPQSQPRQYFVPLHPPETSSPTRFDLITPPNPPAPLPGRLSPGSPNPAWLEEALYGPAFSRKRSRGDPEEEEVKMDWSRLAGVYSAVAEGSAKRKEQDEEDGEAQDMWLKGLQAEKAQRVGERMRKRLGKLMAKGGAPGQAYQRWTM